MIFKLFIDPKYPESVTVNVHDRSPLTDEIERLCEQDNLSDTISGYRDDEICLLHIPEIECFYAENDKTYALSADGVRYQVQKRLCELEEKLPAEYERISKSAIANWKKISRFRVQISGAVDAVFKSGHTECISRRCFADLKRRYDL